MSDRMRTGRFVALIALVLAVFMLIWHLLSRSTQSLQREEEQLQISLTQLQDESASLNSELKNVGTQSYVESQARLQFGYLKEGELRFEFDHPEYLETLTDTEYAIWKRETGQ